MRSPCPATREAPPTAAAREKPMQRKEDPAQSQKHLKIKKKWSRWSCKQRVIRRVNMPTTQGLVFVCRLAGEAPCGQVQGSAHRDRSRTKLRPQLDEFCMRL